MEKVKKVSSWLLVVCFCAFLAMLLIPVDRPEPEPQTDAEWLQEYLYEKEQEGEDAPLTEEELREILGDEFFDTMPELDVDPDPTISPAPIITPTPIIDTSIECMICGGDGRKPCTFCGGTGGTISVNSGPDFGFGSSSYSTTKSCITCGGSREVFCTDCGGDGRIG